MGLGISWNVSALVEGLNKFGEVGNQLNEWVDRVKGARAMVIANVTIDAIKGISACFGLPKSFVKYIDEFKIREGALQSIVGYRDHFIHPFHVFCLGYIILDKWRYEEKGQRLLKHIDEDEDSVLKKWFIASIYHDVGYPSEKLEILVKEFFKTEVDREIKSLFDWSSVIVANNNIKHIRELSELFGKGEQSKIEKFEKWFYKSLFEDHDHGVLTALMLLNKDWAKNDIPLVSEAALAIAIHNWKRVSNNIEFEIGPLKMEEFPLAFFLSYCDTAQEWGRKVLLELWREESMQAKTPEILLDKLDDVEVKQDTTTVTIKYTSGWKDPIKGTETLEKVFDNIRKDFESKWLIEGKDYLEPAIVGVDKNKDKNRLSIGPRIKVR